MFDVTERACAQGNHHLPFAPKVKHESLCLAWLGTSQLIYAGLARRKSEGRRTGVVFGELEQLVRVSLCVHRELSA